jgi:hypothetical protein
MQWTPAQLLSLIHLSPVPSSQPNFLRPVHSTFTRRTSGHCLGTFIALKLALPPVLNVVSHTTYPLSLLSLSSSSEGYIRWSIGRTHNICVSSFHAISDRVYEFDVYEALLLFGVHVKVYARYGGFVCGPCNKCHRLYALYSTTNKCMNRAFNYEMGIRCISKGTYTFML